MKKMKRDNMSLVGMYADQTGWFTDKYFQDGNDNWVELYIPNDIIEAWYDENSLAEETADELNIPVEDCTWKIWLDKVSYGDDTDGLFDFAVQHGFAPKMWQW